VVVTKKNPKLGTHLGSSSLHLGLIWPGGGVSGGWGVANAPMGQLYAKCFNKWCSDHGFGSMRASTRSWCLALNTNLPAIEKWRASLSERERARLRDPQSIVKRWQKATAPKAKPDALAKAEAAWKSFIGCMNALPADQAAPLWHAALAELASMAHA